MIGQLKGVIESIDINHVIVDVGGVGYEVGMPTRVLAKLPPVGTEIKIYTQQVIREDGHFLFGFLSKEERSLFKLLLSVSGVGPKVALSLLGGFELNNLVAAITRGNSAYISSVPGIGSKTAQKIILELKEKVSKAYGSQPSGSMESQKEDTPLLNDAISALIALGYSPREARQALSKVDLGANQTIEQVLKAVLSKI